jgi:hypothetical protein
MQHTLRAILPKQCAELSDTWRQKCLVLNQKAVKWTSGAPGLCCKQFGIIMTLEMLHLLIHFSYCVLSGGLLPFYASGCEASCCKMSGRCKSIPDKHNEEIREKICAYEYQWPEPFPVVAKGLIERLLVVAKSRPTPDDIVEDPFFTSQELGTQNLHRENCELAGIGRNEMGDLFPCAGRRERLPGSFWVSLF